MGLRRPLSELPLYPVLLPVAFILNATFVTGVAIQAAARPMVIAAGVAIIATIGMGLLLRNRHAGAFTLGLTVVLLMCGPLWLVLLSFIERREYSFAALLALPLVAIGVLGARIVRGRVAELSWARLTKDANIIATALLVVIVGTGAARGAIGQAASDLTVPRSPVALEDAGPDVVVVLLDGYPRADALERVFDYDNGPFLERLRELGFDVANRSRSNYASTQLTMASMLHMCHIPQIPDYRRVASREVGEDPATRNLVNRNPVFARFREAGYQVVSIAPGIERITLREADAFHDGGQLSELEYHLLRRTLLDRFIWALDPSVILGQHRDRVLWAFDSLDELASDPAGSRLVFAHILSPHMPAVFTADGSLRVTTYSSDVFVDRRASTGSSVDGWVEPYRDQLTHLNELLLASVARIVEGNPEAIVVLLSDHGSAVHWNDSTFESDHDERHSTLFAARTPGLPDLFADDQTPVNLFQPILNAITGSELPLQPNGMYAGLLELTPLENPDSPVPPEALADAECVDADPQGVAR